MPDQDLQGILDVDIPALFEACRVRVRRAEKFIRELEDIHEKFRKNEPLTAEVTVTTEGEIKAKFAWKALGHGAGAVVGDCVHSLRTALDLMAAEMCRLANEDDKRIYFPIAGPNENFEDAVKRCQFPRCGNDAVELVRTFRPYPGGDNLLVAMHELDIRDKHRAMVLSHARMKYKSNRDQIFLAGFTQKMSLIVTAVDFQFPENGPLAGKSVIASLRAMTRKVESIVEAFEEMVNDRGETRPRTRTEFLG